MGARKGGEVSAEGRRRAPSGREARHIYRVFVGALIDFLAKLLLCGVIGRGRVAHLPQREQYAVEVKNIDRYEMLNQLRAFWPRQAKPPLLIAAPYITTQVAERCREMDLFFADTVGNAYLKAPGLHLYVTGRRKPADFKATAEGKITNPAGLRVFFALLCKPDLLNATYREIAAAARVALGTIGP